MFTRWGRAAARSEGWYDRRCGFQIAFMEWTALAGVACLLFFGLLIRPSPMRQRAALVGIVLLLVYVIVRAVSLHPVDHLLAVRVAGVSLDSLIELGGVAAIGASAALSARRWKAAAPTRGACACLRSPDGIEGKR